MGDVKNQNYQKEPNEKLSLILAVSYLYTIMLFCHSYSFYHHFQCRYLFSGSEKKDL